MAPLAYLFKKQHTHHLIVIEGHQDRQGNITAEMQAAHNPPMNGVPFCDQVCAGNVEQILEQANSAEEIMDTLGKATLQHLIKNDIKAKVEGRQSIRVVKHLSDWAGWKDADSPGVRVFATKPPLLGAAPKWKGCNEVFLGTDEAKRQFSAQVSRAAESNTNGNFTLDRISAWQSFIARFPSAPADGAEDALFRWPQKYRVCAAKKSHAGKRTENLEADAVLVVRQGRDSFAHEGNSRGKMAAQSRARRRKIRELLGPMKRKVEHDMMEQGDWVIVSAVPRQIALKTPNVRWCLAQIVEKKAADSTTDDLPALKVQYYASLAESHTTLPVSNSRGGTGRGGGSSRGGGRGRGRREGGGGSSTVFVLDIDGVQQPLSKDGKPFTGLVRFEQCHLHKQIRLAKKKSSRIYTGFSNTDIQHGYFTYQTLSKIRSIDALGFSWWR